MSWHYLQGPEAVSSEAICWDGEQFAPSKSTTMLDGYCLPDSATACCLASPSGMTLPPSTDTHGTDALTLSAEDSLARTSARPEKGQASLESEAGSGLIWPASSARFDRATSSWKIHPCLFPEDLIPCSVTLPRWGVMRDGELSELTTSVRPTSGTGSGSGVNWPTPKASEPGMSAKTSGRHFTKSTHLTMQIAIAEGLVDMSTGRLWPTPAARDSKGANSREHCEIHGGGRKHMDQLANAVAHPDLRFPTPTTGDANDARYSDSEKVKARFAHRDSPGLAITIAANEESGGSLNPTWVEWLMGWPLGWTDLKPLAMDKFRQWQRSHGRY